MDNIETQSGQNNDREPQPLPKIVRGVGIKPVLNEMRDSSNPSRLALAIRAPLAFNYYQGVYEQDNYYRDTERRLESMQLRRGSDAFVVVKEVQDIPPLDPVPDYVFQDAVISTADEDEEGEFFGKFAMTVMPNDNLVVFGGDFHQQSIGQLTERQHRLGYQRTAKNAFNFWDDKKLEDVAGQIDQAGGKLYGLLGASPKPQVFLYRTDGYSIDEDYLNENRDFIQVWIPEDQRIKGELGSYSLESEIGVQLTRKAIEDYDLINDSRNNLVNSPVLDKLSERVARLRNIKGASTSTYLIKIFEESVDKALDAVYASPFFKNIAKSDRATAQDIVESGYNIKNIFAIDIIFEPVEMPYIFREGFARFMGIKMSGKRTENLTPKAVNVLGESSSLDVDDYYREILTDDYATIVMPAIIGHLHDTYGLSVQELAQAVSKTSGNNFLFESFLESLQLDPEEVKKSWADELRRSNSHKNL